MMMRILRSESKVKLANKLLRTNSPGLLSGSTLTGAMTTGPFLSPRVPLTGGRGGFSPTGEAEESQENTSESKTREEDIAIVPCPTFTWGIIMPFIF